MTRINSAIRINLLTDEHLLAEHREIKRLPAIKATLSNNRIIPKEFKLGTGHVLFFVNKCHFTLKRYLEIYRECQKRGFNPTYYGTNWFDVYTPHQFVSDEAYYVPTENESVLLIERISERLINSKKHYWHYYGKPISKEAAVELLKTPFQND